MSRYIDIEPIEKQIEFELTIGQCKTFSEREKGVLNIYDAIKNAPTADVEKVRHGKDLCYTVYDTHCEFKCSVCNAWIGVVEGGTETLDAARGFNYCPACGAKMDKEKEE